MITIKNYFEQVSNIDFDVLPPEFKEGHAFLIESTDNGTDWESYQISKVIKEAIDEYLKSLNYILNQNLVSKKTNKTSENSTPQTIPSKRKKTGKSKGVISKNADQFLKEKPNGQSKPKINEQKLRIEKPFSKPVEIISDEIKLFKRVINLNDKLKFPKQILSLINAMQRAMAEKRIRKTSEFANEVLDIQDLLISMYHKHMHEPEKEFKVSIDKSSYHKLLKIVGKQMIMPSVRLIKRFINLQGKLVSNEKAKLLYNSIVRALKNQTILPKDPYFDEIVGIEGDMKVFIQKNPQSGYLIVPSKTLNGLNSILSDTDPLQKFKNERGFDQIPNNVVVNSMDLDKLNFETYKFTGKWHSFFGDPHRGFSLMVSSHPKYGKSTLCIEFAHYLANSQGKVLYVAPEEGIGETIQGKFKRLKANHPNLSLVGNFDEKEIKNYDFVFLDSVTRLNLNPEYLIYLKKKYPNISFIYVFQVTKSGVFRGSKSFEHDVDMVVTFPKIGHAKQYGRFNQGGEMTLFKQNHN